MKKLCTIMMTLGLTVCMTACSTAVSGESGDQIVEYIYVSLPNDSGQMTEGTGRILEEMNIALEPYNATVKYVSADDYSVVAESILTGTAHIGTPSGATFVKAHLENPNVVPMFIKAPYGDPEQGGYPAYIATHIDNKSEFEGLSEEEALAKLKGGSFGFVSATSTSGRLVPTATLWEVFGDEGTGDAKDRMDIFERDESQGGIFSEIQYGGNHRGNIELIVNKKVDAGAFCCDYGAGYEDDVYIISEVLVPDGPYWVNKDYMDQVHIDAITDHFINLTPENSVPGLFKEEGAPEDAEGYDREDRFIEVDASFYEFLMIMYAEEE